MIRKGLSLVLLFFAPAALLAQRNAPPGAVIPVALRTTIEAGKTRPGTMIRAEVMQNIPGTGIHRGAQVLGHVIRSAPDELAFRFDTLINHGSRIPIITNLRAMASMMDIDFAQIPEGGADRALPPELRTITLIGGEQDYRGGGPVARGVSIVGRPTPHGVLAALEPNPPCRDGFAGNHLPQALWLFSTNACGLYGFSGVNVAHFGRTNPTGVIVLKAAAGRIKIRSGSGLLLRAQSS